MVFVSKVYNDFLPEFTSRFINIIPLDYPPWFIPSMSIAFGSLVLTVFRAPKNMLPRINWEFHIYIMNLNRKFLKLYACQKSIN